MKIYTKSGDKGETSLVAGVRVPKFADRVEAYGTCDEANSQIGLALSLLPQSDEWNELHAVIHIIQTKLFHVGTECCLSLGKAEMLAGAFDSSGTVAKAIHFFVRECSCHKLTRAAELVNILC